MDHPTGEYVVIGGRMIRLGDVVPDLFPVDREQPPRAALTYDPLQDHLDEPFPEELR